MVPADAACSVAAEVLNPSQPTRGELACRLAGSFGCSGSRQRANAALWVRHGCHGQFRFNGVQVQCGQAAQSTHSWMSDQNCSYILPSVWTGSDGATAPNGSGDPESPGDSKQHTVTLRSTSLPLSMFVAFGCISRTSCCQPAIRARMTVLADAPAQCARPAMGPRRVRIYNASMDRLHAIHGSHRATEISRRSVVMWQLLLRDFAAEYYVKIDDDTLVVAPATLQRVLQRVKPAYWGACATQYRGTTRRGRVTRILRFVYHTEAEEVLYAQGGLYALSRATAEAVAATLPRTAELFQAGARSHRSGHRIETEEDSLVGLAVRLLGRAVTCTTRVHGIAMSDDMRGPCRGTCRSQLPLRSLNPTCVQPRGDVAIHPVKAGIPLYYLLLTTYHLLLTLYYLLLST